MTVINTNIKGLYTQAALKLSERAGQVAMEQLSTGKRINSAKDDAAGMAIAARMTQQIRGLNQASRNAGDAISFIQTIEGATNEITNMLQRMSELAVQAANDTYSSEQRGFLDLEFQQLKTEIVRISEKYNWNGFKIMDGTAGAPIGPEPVTLTQSVVVGGGTATVLGDGDLIINGTPIPINSVAMASYDPFSDDTAASSDPAASAIAIAEAINEKQSITGVRASATGPVTSGNQTTIGTETGTQYLFVNGEQIPIDMDTADTPAERRAKVITAINNTPAAGTTASDNGTGGVTLTTKDGRNLSVWYNTTDTNLTAASFGLGATGTGSVGTLTATGTAEIQTITFSSVPANTTALSFSIGGGTAISYTVDTATNDTSLSVFRDNLVTALAGTGYTVAAGDADGQLKITWTAVGNQTLSTVSNASPTIATPKPGVASPGQQVGITFSTLPSEGETISITAGGNTVTYVVSSEDMINGAVDSSTLLDNLVTELNTNTAFNTNVTAYKNGSTLNLQGNTATTTLSTSLKISAAPVTGIAGATASSTTADTLYGTVTLRSDADHIIVTSSTGDLDDLAVAVGDTDQAGDPVRQYAGRMSFQVGPIADQIITIDMYDWGKNGALTGEVTGDVDRAIPKVNVRTVADANAVIDKLTRVMDNVNAKRADMGAVMNRLEHVIDNLNVVARNAEASRSQIEDADYAKASTELARTQIMQQAATAVLAQANASQQSVLKLLQG